MRSARVGNNSDPRMTAMRIRPLTKRAALDREICHNAKLANQKCQR